jgi:hypothetical protein
MHQHCGSHWGAVSLAKCSRARRARAGAPAGRRAALQRWQGALRFRWTTTKSELAARMVTGCKGAATCLTGCPQAAYPPKAQFPVEPIKAAAAGRAWTGRAAARRLVRKAVPSACRRAALPGGSSLAATLSRSHLTSLASALPGETTSPALPCAGNWQLTAACYSQPLPICQWGPLAHSPTRPLNHARTHPTSPHPTPPHPTPPHPVFVWCHHAGCRAHPREW